MIQKDDISYLAGVLPFWKSLKEDEKTLFLMNIRLHAYQKGESIHSGDNDCIGVMLVKTGELRVYMLSDQGREITLFRPVAGEACILSASCILKNIDFEVFIDAQKKSEVYIMPSGIYDQISQSNSLVENFTNQIISARFSDVMWVMEQVLFMSFDKRLAIFLLEQWQSEKSKTLAITHEIIAKHLGSAREVVSRMLKYFAEEGLVVVFRGHIKIIDIEKLQERAK